MEQKELLEDSRTQRLLIQLLQQQQLQTSALQKQLFFTRLIALLLAVTMAVLLATAAILLPQAQDILKDVNTVSRQLAAVDWARMAQEIENLALTSRESMAEVLLQVQKLDLDTLNETIQDFNEILTPLASFFGG